MRSPLDMRKSSFSVVKQQHFYMTSVIFVYNACTHIYAVLDGEAGPRGYAPVASWSHLNSQPCRY